MGYPSARRGTGRAFLSRLVPGPNLLGVPGRRVGWVFLGQPVSGPNPLEALGLGRWPGVLGLGPRYPQKFFIFAYYFVLKMFVMMRNTSDV